MNPRYGRLQNISKGQLSKCLQSRNMTKCGIGSDKEKVVLFTEYLAEIIQPLPRQTVNGNIPIIKNKDEFEICKVLYKEHINEIKNFKVKKAPGYERDTTRKCPWTFALSLVLRVHFSRCQYSYYDFCRQFCLSQQFWRQVILHLRQYTKITKSD